MAVHFFQDIFSIPYQQIDTVTSNGCKHPTDKKHGNIKQVLRNYKDNCTRGNGQINDNQNNDIK